jgi:putative transposase
MAFYIVIPGNTPWETIEEILHHETKSINFANLFAVPAPFKGIDYISLGASTHATRHHEVTLDVFDYVERFYNPTQRHSTLGYLSPAEYEKTGGSA